jgi:hypothetical protein
MLRSLFLIIVFSSATALALFTNGNFSQYAPKELSSQEATARWGQKLFAADKFKSGAPGIRAQMAADIVKKNLFSGKSVREVWAALGPHDGHFKSDVVPAYILNEDTNDVWQLVFLVDMDRKVTKAVIYKNCCER